MKFIDIKDVEDNKNYIIIMDKGEMRFALAKHEEGINNKTISFYVSEWGWGDVYLCSEYDVYGVIEIKS